MYDMLINIIIIRISIILFYNIYIFLIINKKIFFVITQKNKLMKFLKHNIDSQSFKNVGILNI